MLQYINNRRKGYKTSRTGIEVKPVVSKTIVLKTLEHLNDSVNSNEITSLTKKASSVLIQLYLPETNPEWAMAIESILREQFPEAVIVGGSSMGGIAHGEIDVDATVVAITFFDQTQVKGLIIDGAEATPSDLGNTLQATINKTCQDVAGVMLLATTSNMDVAEFLTGFSNSPNTYPVFGGGTGDVTSIDEPLVFLDNKCLLSGVVAVVFMGTQIKIEAHTYLGWQALSKEMVVTEKDGLWVKKIDDKPAFEVYQHYLGIENDENFFFNAIEFPFLLKRSGIEYAKSPSEVNAENAIKFFADIKEGEAFRIGYGNPRVMIEQARAIQNRIDNFNPESIFLFSCVCRRFLLHDDINLETKPFEKIAPTFGFYTFGEIYGCADSVHILNSTMVAISMKEGLKSRERIIRDVETSLLNKPDPLANKHSRSISRLVNFIQAVTEELEETNEEARRLAERDYLTQAYNRVKVNEFMENEMKRSHRYGRKFSILILDMDLFKKVNDEHGHNVGDAVLSQLVRIIDREIRDSDILSRWGGEEFLVVMPETVINGAIVMAERIRRAVEQADFPQVFNQTCSLGVTTFRLGEHIEETIDRADRALYEAKRKGRNCVVAS